MQHLQEIEEVDPVGHVFNAFGLVMHKQGMEVDVLINYKRASILVVLPVEKNVGVLAELSQERVHFILPVLHLHGREFGGGRLRAFSVRDRDNTAFHIVPCLFLLLGLLVSILGLSLILEGRDVSRGSIFPVGDGLDDVVDNQSFGRGEVELVGIQVRGQPVRGLLEHFFEWRVFVQDLLGGQHKHLFDFVGREPFDKKLLFAVPLDLGPGTHSVVVVAVQDGSVFFDVDFHITFKF